MKYLLTGQESTRLRFRLLEKEDFDTWLDLFKNPDVAGFIGFADIPTAEEQCKKWFAAVETRYNNDTGGLNVLIDKSTNEFIGQCGLLVQEVDNKQELEIGYSILPKFWNMGYATEAAQKCRDYAFEHSFTESIISIVHIDNIKSEKVALKNGMVKSKQTIFRGMPVNIFRINKEEWLTIKK